MRGIGLFSFGRERASLNDANNYALIGPIGHGFNLVILRVQYISEMCTLPGNQ